MKTKSFEGNVLVMNNEQCGKNGKGGVSLWGVTDPLRPFKLSEDFGHRGFADTKHIHSAFAWQAGGFGWTVPIVSLPDRNFNGPTVFGGYGCPDDVGEIPPPSVVGPIGPDEEAILVLQRGPANDPNYSQHVACFFSEKVEAAQNAGYGGVIIANHHVGSGAGERPDAFICGGQGHVFTPTIPAICIGHRTFDLLFNTTPDFTVPYPTAGSAADKEPAIGTLGERVVAPAKFDGWGYVHLFDAETLQELDTYAIAEAHDEAFASGFGDLTVHEVATDPQDVNRAYLSYYAGGIRALEIQCARRKGCKLVETGGYLNPNGNDFWGVEAYVRDGQTYILGSDRDSGLWIFRRTP